MQKELELYEILYVVEPTFTEQETEEKIEYYQKFLTEKGSQVMVQNRGKRNFPAKASALRIWLAKNSKERSRNKAQKMGN